VVLLLAAGKAAAGVLTGSAALLADALHSAADLLALGSYLEGAATMLISGVVLMVGLKNGWIALQALMDASVDPDVEETRLSVGADSQLGKEAGQGGH